MEKCGRGQGLVSSPGFSMIPLFAMVQKKNKARLASRRDDWIGLDGSLLVARWMKAAEKTRYGPGPGEQPRLLNDSAIFSMAQFKTKAHIARRPDQ